MFGHYFLFKIPYFYSLSRYFVSSGSILNAESIAIGTSEPKVATFAISVTISATSTARCPAGNKQQRCRQLDSGAGNNLAKLFEIF